MQMRRDFKKTYERFRSWMFDAALPLWSTNGVDSRGGFRERLALDSSVIVDDETRIRVQGRQTYCFAQAYSLGWAKGRDLALMGIETLRQKALLPSGLPGMLMTPGKDLVDDRVDLYDVAFYLFALAEVRLHINYECLDKDISATLLSLQENLQRPVGEGGYKETIPTTSLREQNPHMHLLEAVLSVYQGTKNDLVKNIALSIFKFVDATFFDTIDGGLHELSLSGGRPDMDRYEAGHQFEWVWLLDRMHALNIRPVQNELDKLFQKGCLLTNADGWIPLSHNLSGAIHQNVYRAWIQTEALKAFLVLHERGNSIALGYAIRACEILLDYHLLSNGGWIDKYNDTKTSLSEDMPASTFYHVVCAFSEMHRINKNL